MNSTTIFSNIYFEELFVNRPSKWISIIFSVAVVICFAPLFYAIIWYEKNGSNKRRTLIDLLSSLLLYVILFYLLIVKTGDVLIYTIGPFPSWVCHIHVLFKVQG